MTLHDCRYGRALGGAQHGVQEDAVLEFLNSDPVLRWAEVTLGL